ncbi:RING finger protein 122 [Egretta garzetta]|uniref:RING finger protein 122 n=1 Tax=Egretta garzetta TaxID=188379 RepID=UPI00163B8E7E|nr:RING finger protein 122 [Egretta garzetta]
MPPITFQDLPLNIYMVIFGTGIFVFVLSLIFCCYFISKLRHQAQSERFGYKEVKSMVVSRTYPQRFGAEREVGTQRGLMLLVPAGRIQNRCDGCPLCLGSTCPCPAPLRSRWGSWQNPS